MPPKPPLRIPRPSNLPKNASSQNHPAPIISKPAVPRAIPKQRTTPTATPPPPPPPPTPRRTPLRSYGGYGLASILFLISFRDVFYSIDTVNGSSMAPTLSPRAHETGEQDWIVISRRHGDKRSIQRGDVVTFWKPHKPSEISIKRVIGVAGDVVYPHRGYALDPAVVAAAPGGRLEGAWDGLDCRDPDAIAGDKVELGKVTVPPGHVWVEGDNWRRSFDSCDFGPVSLGLLDGKAKVVWRGWFGVQPVGDERRRVKGCWTRVVEGVAEEEGLEVV